MKTPQRILWTAITLLLTVGCDQATKRIATHTLKSAPAYSYLGDTFRLVYAENRGAFLSLGASLPDAARFWILTVIVGLLLVGIVLYTLLSPKLHRAQVIGYALIGGGGISNWVDRATHDGLVVDFMNMGIGPLRTGVFNVADLAIIAGIALLMLESWTLDRQSKRALAP
ncbi:MAG: signal peptidase II [Myxococcota bacterium]